MSGPAFGFSVGDFINAVELTYKVVKALKPSGGASTRYIQVLQQLESLQRLLADLEGISPTQDDAPFVNAIRGAARAAQYPLNGFLAKIEQYDPVLNPTHRQSTLRRAPKAVKWTLNVEDEIERLHTAIDAHLLSLGLLLQLREHRVGDIRESRRRLEHEEVKLTLRQQKSSVDDVSAKVESCRVVSQARHQETLDAIASVHLSSHASQSTLNDVKHLTASLGDQLHLTSTRDNKQYQSIAQAIVDNTAQLINLQRNIAQAPATQPDSCIHLLDALDRPHKLPYEYFQDFALVQTHLSTKFKNAPGCSQVRAGLYQLVHEGRNPRIITANEWFNTVFPGSRVSMAVMLSSLRLAPNRCPRQTCHCLVGAKDLQKTRLRCDQCHLVYYPYNPQRMYGPQSEVRMVAQLQSKHDHDEHGRRYHPADLSMIASVSNPTVSVFSNDSKLVSAKSDSTRMTNKNVNDGNLKLDAPLPVDLARDHKLAPLTSTNLRLWRDTNVQHARQELPIPAHAPVTGHMSLLGHQKETRPSAMMTWLYSSANPSPGDHPPPIEDSSNNDSDTAVDEMDDLETLRRVCIARSMPAARHYLDAPEYTGMDGQAVLYLRKILDLYPKAPPVIARRLAQRNLAWVSKMIQQRALANCEILSKVPEAFIDQKRKAKFQCHLCLKRFMRDANLRAHLRAHRDRSPICKLCGEPCENLRDLGRHKALHHEPRFDAFGRSQLSKACTSDDLEETRYWFKQRPEQLNEVDFSGRSPLRIAVGNGLVDVVDFLLQQGADPDKDWSEATPLVAAVEGGHLEVVKLLLEFGANPCLGNEKGVEPYDSVRHGTNYEQIRKMIADAKEQDYRETRKRVKENIKAGRS